MAWSHLKTPEQALLSPTFCLLLPSLSLSLRPAKNKINSPFIEHLLVLSSVWMQPYISSVLYVSLSRVDKVCVHACASFSLYFSEELKNTEDWNTGYIYIYWLVILRWPWWEGQWWGGRGSKEWGSTTDRRCLAWDGRLISITALFMPFTSLEASTVRSSDIQSLLVLI